MWGAEIIASHLSVSKPKFYKLIKVGMPAVVIDGIWVAHKTVIDEWFQQLTKVKMKEIPEDAV
jgi:predicted methyltransferase